GQPSAHLLPCPGRKLTASGATASNRPGPQIAGTVPGVTGPGAGTVRLAAAPVVLADTAPPEIPDSSQPLKQAGTPGLQLRQQRTGHSASNLIVLVTTRLRRDQPQLRSSTSVSHTRRSPARRPVPETRRNGALPCPHPPPIAGDHGDLAHRWAKSP